MSSLWLSSLICSRTTTAAELEEIQRFRYRVSVQEQRKALSTADHHRKMLVDPIDVDAWHYAVRTPDDVFIGSCRLHVSRRLAQSLISKLMFVPDKARPRGAHAAILLCLSRLTRPQPLEAAQ